ncbi:hypothetical protein GCM10023093_21470 [Nemorincola caseinilytica]|uniref:UbiA prenyltransferase family protein n=1 Tax=Nemorincola caseinilytica TaxID=2054315 RepID=A0ABP8NGU6_9BACT
MFTACCALGLCMATEQLIAPGSLQLITPLHGIIVGSTLVVYDLPRLIPRPYGRPRPHQPLKKWYIFFFCTGVLLTGLSLLWLPLKMILLCAIMGMFAFAYFLPALPGRRKRLRDFGLLKILVLTSVWTIATTALPMMLYGAEPMHYPFEFALRFVLVFVLCVLFDLQDIPTDISYNIATLPHRLGERRSYLLVYVSLAVFVALSVAQYVRYPLMPQRSLAALLTAVATIWVALYVRRRPDRAIFIALTDGMMLLYAVLVLLPIPG